MGGATALVGVLPTYAIDRHGRPDQPCCSSAFVQGLALGGEYGGAAGLRRGTRARLAGRGFYYELHPNHGRRWGLFCSLA
jgi:hypothetical protein